MKAQCKYCKRKMSASGLPAHVHYRHRGMVLAEFVYNSYIQAYNLIEHGAIRPFEQKQLPAPNPLTIYSTRPLGRMASPLPYMRRPKGYTLGFGYRQPWRSA